MDNVTSASDIQEELSKCTRCGLCSFACPSFQEKKEEQYSPRGMITLLKYGFTGIAQDQIKQGCNSTCSKEALCSSYCPTSIDFTKLITFLNNN